MKDLKVERINNKDEITSQLFNHSTVKLRDDNVPKAETDLSSYRLNDLTTVKRLRKHCAFTLAELLITLAIIGVVAALMAPIYGGIMKHVYATNTRRDMLAVENLFSELRAEFGEYNAWPKLNSPEFFEAIERRINVSEVYDGSVAGGTYNNKNNPYDAPYFGCYFGSCKQYVLLNGKIWTFSVSPHNGLLYIAFDTNGAEGPNTIGVDIFWMYFNVGKPYLDSKNHEIPTGIWLGGQSYSTEDLLVGTIGRCYRSPLPNSSNAHSYDTAYAPVGMQSCCLELLSRSNWKMEGIYPIKEFWTAVK